MSMIMVFEFLNSQAINLQEISLQFRRMFFQEQRRHPTVSKVINEFLIIKHIRSIPIDNIKEKSVLLLISKKRLVAADGSGF